MTYKELNKLSLKNLVLKYIQTVLCVFLFGVGFLLLFKIGFRENARVECLQWKEQETEYPLFYSTDWQKEQCAEYGINFVD
jgi:hypothetical protein